MRKTCAYTKCKEKLPPICIEQKDDFCSAECAKAAHMVIFPGSTVKRPAPRHIPRPSAKTKAKLGRKGA